MTTFLLDRSQVGILLIDAQPFFWEKMFGSQEPVLLRIKQLLMVAGFMKLPLIATFESPIESKGELPERLEKVFPAHGQRFTKQTFNCCAEPPIREAIQQLVKSQIVVAGAETDVCVLQSVMGLLEMNLQVFVLEDCLFTSEPYPQPALERMYRAGAIPCTLKACMYELARSVTFFHEQEQNPEFITFIEEFIPPEILPPWNCRR